MSDTDTYTHWAVCLVGMAEWGAEKPCILDACIITDVTDPAQIDAEIQFARMIGDEARLNRLLRLNANLSGMYVRQSVQGGNLKVRCIGLPCDMTSAEFRELFDSLGAKQQIRIYNFDVRRVD